MVSIPNGKSGPLRPINPALSMGEHVGFQSQTGSQALSDTVARFRPGSGREFQSQTGSQALSDAIGSPSGLGFLYVSIPNGKSGPLRPELLLRQGGASGIVSIPNGKSGPLRRYWSVSSPLPRWCFNPKREVRPSQTMRLEILKRHVGRVSIPNGKSGPLRPRHPLTARGPGEKFQSQTGSQALSDIYGLLAVVDAFESFNPKREVRPSQTPGQPIFSNRDFRF